MSEQVVTLKQVADRVGVHPATVSRALNPGTADMVNTDTLARIVRVADELGYQPNPLARGLKTQRTHTVGVLIPDIANPVFPPIIRAIEDVLGEVGYTALLGNTDNDAEREQMHLRAMRARQVDGFIIATARSDDPVLVEAASEQIPIVLVNRKVEGHQFDAVVDDDRAGTSTAVAHLVELGHRRIAHVAGPESTSTGTARRLGFLAATREHGLDCDDLVVHSKVFDEDAGAAATRRLLSSGAEPTAIVAGNDLIALGCLDAMAESGLECPDDVSLVGFNDMPFVDKLNPPLTTVRIPRYDMGVEAARLLLDRIANPDTPARTLLLETQLVVRGSTAPPHAG